MKHGQDISHAATVAVLRAADDLRRGEQVLITDGAESILVTAAESASPSVKAKYCLLTRNRAVSLNIAPEDWPTVRVNVKSWMKASDLVALADPTLDLVNPMKGPFPRIASGSPALDQAAITLLKIANLLPAAIILDVSEQEIHTLTVSVSSITGLRDKQNETLKEVARANIPLSDAESCQLVSFRSSFGGEEHLALIIGDPDFSKPILTRLHSACLTGDLLGSLKCDCGEQLRGAISALNKSGGGLLLYMAQEGRGIGLMAKLKAYRLQEDGYDTVDANHKLGFETDERGFEPAAKMLQQLGITSVRLMTNNPDKVNGLEAAGVIVKERVSHKFPPNPHNLKYLEVKKSRTGHIL